MSVHCILVGGAIVTWWMVTGEQLRSSATLHFQVVRNAVCWLVFMTLWTLSQLVNLEMTPLLGLVLELKWAHRTLLLIHSPPRPPVVEHFTRRRNWVHERSIQFSDEVLHVENTVIVTFCLTWNDHVFHSFIVNMWQDKQSRLHSTLSKEVTRVQPLLPQPPLGLNISDRPVETIHYLINFQFR